MVKAKTKRRKPQLKIPVIATAAVVAVPFIPLPGRGSIFGDAKAGKWEEVGRSLAHGFLGQKDGNFGQLTVPWYTVMLVLGAAGSMVASKLGLNRFFSKIPFIKL